MQISWTEVKKLLAKTPFPSKEIAEIMRYPNAGNIGYKEYDDEKHSIGKKRKEWHQVKTYEWTTKFEGYTITWKYQACLECRQVVMQRATIFNDKENLAYHHYYKKAATSGYDPF